ncbi:DNA processing protein [Natranaerovirga hydrolytica]|uniref:DNA processing protein n=1 Tax=Natranaerovirga hydrolytica TaxID=680378 RepID=A0A4V2Q1J5_9FIRM|nr:DNA-processing protein DprA [Natranaerovirga hydrolytica]TCK97881.1 DNA processing protein [Natranaerovirga hydrolytica]
MNNNYYWYWLCNIEGIGNKKINKLIKYFKEPKEIWTSKENMFYDIQGISEKDIHKIQSSKDEEKIIRGYNELGKRNIKFIHIKDEKYPQQLKKIYDYPHGLYYTGELPNSTHLKIAIVGARKCSNYGKEMARYFAKELAKRDVEVVSGLARGIDTYAHIGALEGNGKTFGVVGNGLNISYPKENFKLQLEVGKKGGVMSEYNINTEPKKGHFPLRNRIISGLVDGILIIEAAKKSGSLITAEIGLEQGKEIFALPGRIIDKLSEGTNDLIKLGGKMVTNIEDILEEFQYKYVIENYNTISENIEKNIEKKVKSLDKNEKIVYACLNLEPKHIENILNEINLNIQEINHILLVLEMKGFIKQLPNKYYIIKV